MHRLGGLAAGVAGVGAVLAVLVNTVFSLVIGVLLGGVVAAIVHLMPFGHHGKERAPAQR